MALFANCILFFVLFLPLTLLVGLSFDFYLGRFQPAEEAVPIIYWLVAGWPLLIPSFLFIPVLHIMLATVRRRTWAPDRRGMRMLSLVAFPMGLLLTHFVFWGGTVLSIPLLVTFLIPGAILGWVARIPRTRAQSDIVSIRTNGDR
jgi:hypothetical protein